MPFFYEAAHNGPIIRECNEEKKMKTTKGKKKQGNAHKAHKAHKASHVPWESRSVNGVTPGFEPACEDRASVQGKLLD